MIFDFINKNKKDPKNLKEAVSLIKNLEKNLQELSKEFQELKNKSQKFVQKVGIVRFNPYTSKVGGDQSFSVALLDENNDGVVITNLYTFEGNRVYAKPVVKGGSKYSLAGEEKEAIKKAEEIQEKGD